jgi:hypothetical protein
MPEEINFSYLCYVKNMNGLDLALNPNLNLPLTLKKIKIMSMIKIKNACINKDCVCVNLEGFVLQKLRSATRSAGRRESMILI